MSILQSPEQPVNFAPKVQKEVGLEGERQMMGLAPKLFDILLDQAKGINDPPDKRADITILEDNNRSFPNNYEEWVTRMKPLIEAKADIQLSLDEMDAAYTIGFEILLSHCQVKLEDHQEQSRDNTYDLVHLQAGRQDLKTFRDTMKGTFNGINNEDAEHISLGDDRRRLHNIIDSGVIQRAFGIAFLPVVSKLEPARERVLRAAVEKTIIRTDTSPIEFSLGYISQDVTSQPPAASGSGPKM